MEDELQRLHDVPVELAAQLLAAKFNYKAQAAKCPDSDTAITDGQALLAVIKFTGAGEYLPPKTKNTAQRNQALAIASTLDRYNNGVLC